MEKINVHPVLSQYKFYKNLNQKIVQNVKSFYTFGVNGTELFLVTNDDDVYAFGRNDHKWLGTGDARRTTQLRKITELCYKCVIKIDSGSSHVVVLTSYGRFYTIGENSCGQLGDGSTKPNDSKTPILNILKNIVDISCGGKHTMLLTRDGDVYCFGDNSYGQIGNDCFEIQLKPTKLIGFDSKVEHISSGLEHSLAQTVNGTVYAWGCNESNQLGLKSAVKINTPTLVKYFSDFSIYINQICCGRECSLLVSNLCDLYIFDRSIAESNTDVSSVKLQNVLEIGTSIHNNLIVVSKEHSKELFIWFWGEIKGDKQIIEPIKSDHNTIEETFVAYLDSKVTYKFININNNIIESPNKYDGNHMKQFKYKREFSVIREITYGAFAQIYEVYNIIDRKSYIIKKIETIDPNFYKTYPEIALLEKLQSDYVVKYYECWLERDEDYSPEKYFLYIKLECGKITLTEVIDDIKNNLSENYSLTPIGYYIASELFLECLECIDYLHNQIPSVIHRNLTTNNILVTTGDTHRFIKICSFGFSTTHCNEDESHSEHVGTIGYMAPEVSTSSKYDTSADIYSLGIIMQKLFSLDINEKNPQFHNLLIPKYKKLREILLNMLSAKNYERKTCRDIMESRINWSLSINELSKNINLNDYKSLPSDIDIKKCFHKFFLKHKLKTVTIGEQDLTRKLSNLSPPENNRRFVVKTVDTFDSINLNELLRNSKYSNEFDEIKEIGNGGFGFVFESMKYSNGEHFAVKKIPIENEPRTIKDVNRELSLLSRLRSNYVVQYVDHWIEHNYYLTRSSEFDGTSYDNTKLFNKRRIYLLHIQMELCSTTLSSVIREMKQNFYDSLTKTFSPIGYFVASQILIEVLECVHFLHHQNPPIIHRDLKPSNILLTNGLNGRFVKLADFGLATVHKYEGNTSDIGTQHYMAPEVCYSKFYDFKADIYSLGIIVQNLFHLSLTNPPVIIENVLLKPKYNYLHNVGQQLLLPVAAERLSCEQMLTDKQLWSISVTEIRNVPNFDHFFRHSMQMDKTISNFLKNFIAIKLNMQFS